jgi:nicotinamide-nucleotide amidase
MFADALLSLARDTLERARKQNLRIATAESCTGGLIAACLTEIPGSSDVMDRGFITYANTAKTELLGIQVELLAKHGAVSEQVARAMAEGALKAAKVQLAISCTGVAGPTGGSTEKPVGLVHIAIAREGRPTLHRECRFGDIGRGEIRMKTVEATLLLAAQAY